MVLSNAERQARYRKNIKARANDPGAGARAAAETATAAIWAMLNRTNDGAIADHPEFEGWRANWVRDDLPTLCRQLLSDADFSPEELDALRVVVEIDDALKLRHADS